MYTEALTWPQFKLSAAKVILWITTQIHDPKNRMKLKNL